ncbi:hypothetical protein [Streptomyces millisiae]|uniref:Uncharacterized protein n=1 Tax=Streptomyces millisiae TaxID=3075542 RepID=A0ABU2LN02_9ACTN|nr:hypothetical protein [Streptomyces sp. DSM 44918]MDT0318970.1 hypothetical protein [Streptomyces sp. DSM 44918]
MSSGYAVPDVTFVAPDVQFPAVQAPALDLVDLPSADVITDQVLDVLGTAVLGLGALSGALLAARAAMAGTRLLANAAVRAADAQCLRGEELRRARASRDLWRDAAFAVCRANARIDALRARIDRDGPAGGPGPDGRGPAPLPELPPALDPVGLRLDDVHRWLGDTDRAVRLVEAELARRTMAAAAAALGTRAGDEAAARRAARLRARRERALAGYAGADTETAAGAALPAYTTPLPDAGALGEERATELGAELLAGLDPAVPVAECVAIQRAVGHAVELAEARPAAAARHLSEARELAFAANWRAADRRETAEWAAQQLRFLRQPLPEGVDPRPEPGAELAALERILATGEAPDPRQRAEISARVAAREAALQRAYVSQLLRRELAALATGARPRTRQAAPGVEHIEWVPPGWGTEHWLRFALDTGGTLRVQTVHRARAAHEDTREARELDRRRCHEAGQHVARLAETAAEAGLSLDLVFDGNRVTADTVLDHTPAPAADRRPDDQEPRARRHHPGEQRP